MKTWNDYMSANHEVMRSVSPDELGQLLRTLEEVRAREGSLWVLGNGGSASLASHAVADFSKTASSIGGKPLKTFAPSEMVALQSAFSNDLSFEEAFSTTFEMYLQPIDGVLIFSVSGKSPNIIQAIASAKSLGSSITGVVGKSGEHLRSEADALIVLETLDYQIVENVQVSIMHWLTKNL